MSPDYLKLSEACRPATNLHHCLSRLPQHVADCQCVLEEWGDLEVLLVDNCREPSRVRGNAEGLARIVDPIDTRVATCVY